MRVSMSKASALMVLGLSAAAMAQSFCNDSHSGEKVTTKQNVVSSINGIGYELWGEQGDQSATFYSDGSMICEFNGNKDYLCRSGKSYNSDKTYDQLGHLYADFSVKMSNRRDIEYSYIGIYGWTRKPLVEWYIVDSWGTDWRPGDWIGNVVQKGVKIDGALYDVFKGHRKSYSIDGDNTDFDQYFSVRQEKRDCGTIDITAHFKKWEELGMTMGLMHEAKVLGEAGNSGGPKATGVFDFVVSRVYTPEDLAPVSSSSAPESSSSFIPMSSVWIEAPVSASSSSEEVLEPASSSSTEILPPESSSSIDAIGQLVFREDMLQTFSIFDMQGKFLGKIEATSAFLKETLKNRLGNAGVYMVKGANAMHRITIK